MTVLEFLSGVGNVQELSRRSKVLLFAYYLRQYQGLLEFSRADIRQCFYDGLLKIPSDLNDLLKSLSTGRNSPLMKSGRTGSYALAMPGLNEVETYLSVKSKPETEVDTLLKSAIPYLEKVIAKLSDANQRKFLAESIACLGVDAKRATVIMTWACIIAHLYDYILGGKTRLADFNAALQRRTDKFSKIKVTLYDDFSDIPESVFIEVCRSAKIISSDVRKILEEKLGVRNTCAHPSGVEVHKTKVINFIEDLVDNVLNKYPIK
jgi:hypothetical protein